MDRVILNHVIMRIEAIQEIIERQESPIFGICLGHQLLALSIWSQRQ